MEKFQVINLIKEGIFEGDPLVGKLVETHISWVILSKNFAFKIKKPIKYSFLDFSSLTKRKYYCERELVLNKRLTSIYLDVIPVRLWNNRIFLGNGKGTILDFALRMKRLQAGRKMDIMLKKNRINETNISTLANTIATFHKNAEVINKPFSKTNAKNAFNDISGITEWVENYLGNGKAAIIKNAVFYSNTYLDRAAPIITKRIQNKFKRDVHGDLHSKNIFIYKEPVIFDCIEFNNDFRQIDVLNEVAFFCMDLEGFQRPDLSKSFMECYLELFPCMNDNDDRELYIYYKAYRANVRAKVNALRAMQARNEAEIKKYTNDVKKYLDLLDHYISGER